METSVITTEIILCECCAGFGKTILGKWFNRHTTIFENVYKDCTICDRAGRVKRITCVTIEKFTQED